MGKNAAEDEDWWGWLVLLCARIQNTVDNLENERMWGRGKSCNAISINCRKVNLSCPAKVKSSHVYLFEQMFQTFEDEGGVPQDRANAAVQQHGRPGSRAANVVVVRGGITVVFVSLPLYRTFEGDWEGDGYSGEFESKLGSPAEVEVGEFTEGALHLEQMGDFRV